MLMVRAPAAMAASHTRHRKSMSERTASSGENSTSSVYWRARLTICTARSSTCSGVMRSLCCMWIGLVAMKVWMRPRVRRLDGLGGAVDVFFHGTRQRTNRTVLHGLGHGLDRLEVAGAGGREAGLDDVHAHALQGLGDAHLLVAGHGRARALFAVAQRGVENDQFVIHSALSLPDLGRSERLLGVGLAYCSVPRQETLSIMRLRAAVAG